MKWNAGGTTGESIEKLKADSSSRNESKKTKQLNVKKELKKKKQKKTMFSKVAIRRKNRKKR